LIVVKVHTCVPVDGNSLLIDSKDKFVTHADYKALEEVTVGLRFMNDDAHREIQRLKAELAECRADAERYRWLRDPTSAVGLVIDKLTGEIPYDEGTQTGGYGTYEYRAGDELDDAIDNAIARSKA
jgi:hypothetical protein